MEEGRVEMLEVQIWKVLALENDPSLVEVVLEEEEVQRAVLAEMFPVAVDEHWS